MMLRLLFAACLAVAVLGHDTRTTISLPLTEDGGKIRKCTPGFGLYGGRQDSLSLYGNKGGWSHNDTSDSSGGFCTFHSSVDKGNVESYSVSVDMYHVGNNAENRGGIAVNVVDKCNFDFVFFRPQQVATCLQLGAMRGCHWAQVNPWWSLPCPDGAVSRSQWYGVKVDVSPDTITVSKKEPGAAWMQAVSVQTTNLFGSHLVARAGLFVLNGNDDTTYFNKFELEYLPRFEAKTYTLELRGSAVVGELHDAKRAAVALFQGISSDFSVHFVAEHSNPTMRNNGLKTVSLPLTTAGGTVRKCSPAFGAYGGREDTVSLHANRGVWSHDDSDDGVNGFCTFLTHEDLGSYHPYSVTVDLYHESSGPHSHAGLAYNIIDKCTWDFAQFNPGHCLYVGAMRGCQFKKLLDLETCPDGSPSWREWYSMKVDVTADAVVVSKRSLGAAWVQAASVATTNTFGNHPVARAGLLVSNGFQDTAYFNRLELQYIDTVSLAKNTFSLKLSGTAAVSELSSAKRTAVALFRNVSSNLDINYLAEPSKSRRLLLV